jgi:hypothetical protein
MADASGGCPGLVRLEVADPQRRGPQALLGIVGRVEVHGDDGRLVTLRDIPIVELARQLDRWLIGITPDGPDFVYTSLGDPDVPGLVYFYRAPPCWRVGSVRAEEDREVVTSLRGVAAAAGDFVADVDRLVRPLGVDLPRFLRERSP